MGCEKQVEQYPSKSEGYFRIPKMIRLMCFRVVRVGIRRFGPVESSILILQIPHGRSSELILAGYR